ncbi:type I DNA topoisomerase [Serpentinicella alkaliphila]|uniref:DNA topoisomerase 1 n=1 Tax=Serpentinicella alkaliphila TaxID=1734049 RepID=A0A4R2TSG8_9FIRM|nr:type I DNA topoisomerase [Serpentinicella alkaliphila]QUH26269.1 type I DNA topoisomerase [Serpentinicella alkaliphila]TCQ05847.1 DNA topoisomerase I [Serpentinicella alkaliphila]
MAKSLVIVESPAKAKTIKKFLGPNYTVKASIGHIIDLPKSKLGVDIDNNFDPQYITIRGKGEVLKEIKAEAKKAKKVYLATDPDREGEAISWHLSNALNINSEEPCRIEFNEITKNAIKHAIKHPRKINMHLVDAQQARRVLDRLVGYKISPLLWRKMRKGLSAGRVQSVATKLIKEREEEIKAFIPEEYWSILAKLKTNNGEKFEGKFNRGPDGSKDLSNETEVNSILSLLKKKELTITDIKETEKKRSANNPFTTSTLQQEASNKLGFSTKKTMSVAQQLYEGVDIAKEGTVGLITYIRTDSIRLSDEAIKSISQYIESTYGKEYLTKTKKTEKKEKGVQDAHEAIRPTEVLREPDKVKDSLTKDQYKLYKLIWERTVASQMASAIYDTVSIELQENDVIFKASGSRLKFKGFLEVYTFGSVSEDILLPKLNKGDVIKITSIEPNQHFTQPPARYTEASLVRTMEELGIGRPSTYSPTISTILSRGYVEKDGKSLRPTELGIIVTEILDEFFPEVIDVNFTADFEKYLDSVEDGQGNWKSLIKHFYKDFEVMLQKAEENMEVIDLVEESDEDCNKCNAKMLIKHGRYGKFLACSNYPECTNTKPILNKIGVTCPICQEGEVVERRSKKGRLFYGCSLFPQCRFVSWGKPINEKCPQCNNVLIHKVNKKSEKIMCSSKECKYEREVVGSES